MSSLGIYGTLALATLLGLSGCQISPTQKNPPNETLRLSVAYDPSQGCKVRFEGKSFSLPADEDSFRDALAKLTNHYRSVSVAGEGASYEDVPYKCIGHPIFVAQRAGFKRVGFISEPPPVD